VDGNGNGKDRGLGGGVVLTPASRRVKARCASSKLSSCCVVVSDIDSATLWYRRSAPGAEVWEAMGVGGGVDVRGDVGLRERAGVACGIEGVIVGTGDEVENQQCG